MAWKQEVMHTGFWYERKHKEDLDVGGAIILKWIIEK
jgi:hypothetical protein